MLQAVVGDDHVAFRMCSEQRARRRHAIRRHGNGDARAREQQRLVTDLGCVGIGGDDDRRRARRRATVTAAHDARMPTPPGQRTRQRGHERRLAAAANRDVADDNHRHRQLVCAQQPRAITEQDLLKFVWIADPQVSPDGRQAVYVHVVVNGHQLRCWGRTGSEGRRLYRTSDSRNSQTGGNDGRCRRRGTLNRGSDRSPPQ